MTQRVTYEMTPNEWFVQSVEGPAKELLKQFFAERSEYTGCCYRIEGENAHLCVQVWREDEKKLSHEERELIAFHVTKIYRLFPLWSRSYSLVPGEEDQARYLLFPTARPPRA